jgi:prepilin-type N-terminal cleavage/methylation domain-containing protein
MQVLDMRGVASPHPEAGYTLIEIISVLAIFSILSAVAIPQFLDQKDKARDACVKEQLLSTRMAMEIYRTENGSFDGVTLAELHEYDKAIPTSATGGCPGAGGFEISGTPAAGATCDGAPSNDTFCIDALSQTGNRFQISRPVSGTILRECADDGDGGRGGCPSSNFW